MRRKFTPNQYYIDGDTAELILTDQSGRATGHAVIDIDDLGPALAAGRWFLDSGYARTSSGMTLHRLIMGDPSGIQVDHINHDRLDCRRSNLRLCTIAENSRNKSGARPESRSGIRNLTWVASRRRWRVKVKAGGREHHIGYFRTQEEAEAAARDARQRLHGEFAS